MPCRVISTRPCVPSRTRHRWRSCFRIRTISRICCKWDECGARGSTSVRSASTRCRRSGIVWRRGSSPSASPTSKLVGVGELCRDAVAHHLLHPRASSWGSGELCRGGGSSPSASPTSKLVGVGGRRERRGSSPSASPTSKLVGVGGRRGRRGSSPSASPTSKLVGVGGRRGRRGSSPSASPTSKLVGVGGGGGGAVAHHLLHPRASSWGSGKLCHGAAAYHLHQRNSPPRCLLEKSGRPNRQKQISFQTIANPVLHPGCDCVVSIRHQLASPR